MDRCLFSTLGKYSKLAHTLLSSLSYFCPVRHKVACALFRGREKERRWGRVGGESGGRGEGEGRGEGRRRGGGEGRGGQREGEGKEEGAAAVP